LSGNSALSDQVLTAKVKECLMAGCQKLRDELGYQQSNALEQIAIEHIVTCWLGLSINELLLVEQTKSAAIEQMHRRIEFSAKRFNQCQVYAVQNEKNEFDYSGQ
jgi:hypothetical protein